MKESITLRMSNYRFITTCLNLKEDIIQSHAGDHIIFAVHHPVYANGPTAGNYPVTSHLLPVPIVVSIITGIKSQDRNAIMASF